jgi:hypothetical protein
MKRIVLLSIPVVFAGLLLAFSCSKPLDTERITQGGTDTVFVSDTLIFTDTLYQDTLYIDTLYSDTLYFDTLFVDTLLCGRLSSHRQEIVWLLFNKEGDCGFEFMASVQRVRDPQVLVVDIDSERYLWDLADGLQFAVEQEIGAFAAVRITSEQPHAFGQGVDICLRITSP